MKTKSMLLLAMLLLLQNAWCQKFLSVKGKEMIGTDGKPFFYERNQFGQLVSTRRVYV